MTGLKPGPSHWRADSNSEAGRKLGVFPDMGEARVAIGLRRCGKSKVKVEGGLGGMSGIEEGKGGGCMREMGKYVFFWEEERGGKGKGCSSEGRESRVFGAVVNGESEGESESL